MREAGLDGVLIPIGNGADSRYLTQVRGSVIALPASGAAPAIVMDQGQSNSWIPNPIETVRSWCEPSIEALRQADLETGTIGIAGLGSGLWTHVDAGDGAAIDRPMVAVLQAFPRARFVDATDLVGQLRAAKSGVELALIDEAARTARSALEVAIGRLELGLPREEILASTVGRILELGSEYRPSRVVIRRWDGSFADVCEQESVVEIQATGCVSGYTVTETRSVAVGTRPPGWDATLATSDQTARALVDELRPGVTVHRLAAVTEEVGILSGARVNLEVKGIGLGADGPLLTTEWASTTARSLRLMPGLCLSLTVEVQRSGCPVPARTSTNVVVTDGRPSLLPGDGSSTPA